MSEYIFKLPDLGEGTVEAEVVEWHVKVGDEVKEGDVVADLMTDKATVEVEAPVSGIVARISGEPGDVIAVGAELMAFSSEAVDAGPTPEPTPEPEPEPEPELAESEQTPAATSATPEPARESATKTEPATANTGKNRRILTSPAVRKHAKEAGVDLLDVPASAPNERISMQDLQDYLATRTQTASPTNPNAAQSGRPQPALSSAAGVTDTKVIGVRRVIAERLAQSKREIPHFSYVEEVDVTELEALRAHLNQTHDTSLSILPFVATALLKSLPDFPKCNAHYLSEQGVLRSFSEVHLGIAAHTPDGLKVPVVRAAHSLSLWQLAEGIATAARVARDGSAKPADLSGSTITLTSLGKLGGIASTPIINYPEVAIIGINRTVNRPAYINGALQERVTMNISSSFDHRFVDGYDAASLIQSIRAKLEHPATLFLAAP